MRDTHICRNYPLPEYGEIWDINLVLNTYDSFCFDDQLYCKSLGKKLIVLLIILGVRRKPAFFTISVDNINFAEGKVTLFPIRTLKRSNPRISLRSPIYHRFDTNSKYSL